MVNGKGRRGTYQTCISLLPLIVRHFNPAGAGRSDRKGVNIMSVIGRLDDQVDEIIIKPLGARHRPAKERAPDAAQETDPQPPAKAEKDQAQDDANTQARSSQLPVWLL